MPQELENRIINALALCRAIQKPNVKAIARQFDILYCALRGRFKGSKSPNERTPTNKALNLSKRKHQFYRLIPKTRLSLPRSQGKFRVLFYTLFDVVNRRVRQPDYLYLQDQSRI
jgi:hypothetical protein